MVLTKTAKPPTLGRERHITDERLGNVREGAKNRHGGKGRKLPGNGPVRDRVSDRDGKGKRIPPGSVHNPHWTSRSSGAGTVAHWRTEYSRAILIVSASITAVTIVLFVVKLVGG